VKFHHIPKFRILGCDKTTPLKGKKADQGMIRMEYELTRSVAFIGGILSFFNNHLVDSSSSKGLPSGHENRVGTSIGRWVGRRYPIGVWL
jgi:hypothetical protein